MFNLSILKPIATKLLGRSSLAMKHYSPEILMGAGVIGVVVTVVVACKATLKLEPMLDQANAKLEKIKEVEEQHLPSYSADDSKKEQLVVCTRVAVDIVKLYAPAVGIGVVSVACLLGSHHILRQRNAALTAAYVALSDAFKRYRSRVAEDLGIEQDRKYLADVKKEVIETVDENGNSVKKVVETNGDGTNSPYTFWFTKDNPNYGRSRQAALMFLRAQQHYACDKLRSKGHMFMNECLDMLSINRTEAGQIVGWIDGSGDSYVDFGIFDKSDESLDEAVLWDDSPILLNFNVDGPIVKTFEKTFGQEFTKKLVGDDVKKFNKRAQVRA